jgi:hypothetical protein
MGKADIYSAARKRPDFRELVEDLMKYQSRSAGICFIPPVLNGVEG